MKCKICGNEEKNQNFQILEMMFKTKAPFDYFQCNKCQCLQITEIPQNIGEYYPTNYYSYSESEPHYSSLIKKYLTKNIFYNSLTLNQGILKSFLISIISNYSDLLLNSLSRLTIKHKSKILDVGSGSGLYLKLLYDMGFSNLMGIDPFITKNIEIRPNIYVYKKSLQEINEKFDLIMFHHSLEHMSNPIEILKYAYQKLDENGTLLIRIPTVSSYCWQKYRTFWVQIDAPRHYYLFSKESIEYLAKNSNFTINKIFYDSTSFQFVGSEQNVRLNSLENPNLKSDEKLEKKKNKKYEKMARNLNKTNNGDQFCVYLKKT